MKAKYLKFHGNDVEDRVLYENFDLPDKGVFVDVGAGPNGIQGSNSYFFEKNGWKVICIDADPRNENMLRKNRVSVYSMAISGKIGSAKIQTEESPDLSVLSDTGNVEVKTTTLETILEQEKVEKIDILSLDTEGTELEVWNSFDWNKHRPDIVIVEAVTSGVLNEKVPTYFENIGYVWKATIGPNLIYQWEESIRDPKLIVYGSSYDRGLEHLLKMWPDIKKEIPDAKLEVFYGWNLFDVAAKGNPQMQDWKQRMIELMKQDGITDLGRLSHGAVQKQFEKAGVWAYPTHFGEISCITAMKAQAYGAIPVVVSYAALQETVQYGVKVDGDIYDQETKDEYKKQLIALLQSPDRQEEIRTPMMVWARGKFPWNDVANQWDAEFKGVKSLEKQVFDLMEDNQPLKAWDLVKDTDSPLKERVYLRVRHAFEPEVYKEYYEKHLIEHPLSEEQALNVDKVFPRFGWVVPRIAKAMEGKNHRFADLGCADGYLSLTMAKKYNLESFGFNLHKPSVDLASDRAEKLGLNTFFYHRDLFNVTLEKDGTFPVVVMMEVLEHLPYPQKGVDHAMSLLNDSGHAFFSTPRTDHLGVQQHKDEPNHGSWDDGKPSGHLRLFTEEEFKDLFKNYKIVDFHVDEERCMIAEVTR